MSDDRPALASTARGVPVVPDLYAAHDWRPPEETSPARTLLFRFLPILFLAALAFWPAWSSSKPLWRDDAEITANNPLRSAPGLALIWTAPSVTPHWAPLSYTFLWPQHLVWTDSILIGYHLVNLLLHTVNALLVWLLLRRLEVPGALLAAIVFAVHPVQAEAAGWIAQQPMVFGSLFSLCFLAVSARWSAADQTITNATHFFHLPERPRTLYVLMTVLYVLAALSVPQMAFVLPVIVGLLAWWKHVQTVRDVWRGMIPLFVIGVLAAAVYCIADSRRPGQAFTVAQWLLFVPQAMRHYLGTFLWPTGLSVVYGFGSSVTGGLLGWVVLIAALLGAWTRRDSIGRTPFVVIAAWSLLLLPMVTPLNRVAMAGSPIAERFQYLAMAVASAALVGSIARAAAPLVEERRWLWPVAATVVALFLAIFTCAGYAGTFSSQPDMWDNTLARQPENVDALLLAAKASLAQPDGKKLSINRFARVLRLTDQKNADALVGLGEIYQAEGKLTDAAKYYADASAASPDDARPAAKVGLTLRDSGQVDKSVEYYDGALKKFPNDGPLWRQRGDSLLALGKTDDALQSYNHAITINHFDAAAHLGLSQCYFMLKDAKRFNEELSTAFKLDPMNYDFYMTLATMCVRDRAWDSAYSFYHDASYLRPEAPEPANNIGLVVAMQSQLLWAKGQVQPAMDKAKEAEFYLKRALELKPEFDGAKRNLEFVTHLQERMRTSPPPRMPSSQPATAPATRP